MDSTFTTDSDPAMKVEAEPGLFYDLDDREHSPIITNTHPIVKIEPDTEPEDDEFGNDMSFATTAYADQVVKAEPEPDSDEHGPDGFRDSPMAVVADPVVKTEPEADFTEFGQQTHQASPPPDNALVIRLDRPQTVRVLNMGHTKDKKLLRMKEQGRSILTLCRLCLAEKYVTHGEEIAKRIADAELYLDWLETSLEMTPHIRFVTKLDLVLQSLMDPKHNIPAYLVNKAQNLYTRYTAENWGQDLVVDDDAETPNTTSIVVASAPGGATVGLVELPAPNDPIFGEGGVMYGIIVDNGGNGRSRNYRLRADIPRRSAKVYGHNGIAMGTWFPLQINALFWGAHGSRMGGIAGSVTTGAWSIVVASAYDDLDSDLGDTLYYSGSNSHTNDNPLEAAPPSAGTRALHASIATGLPVRVLRSGGTGSSGRPRNHNRFLPSCGLRYDGLYQVILFRQRTNKKHGLYDQFKLVRMEGQTPLEELQRNSPTADEVRALNRLRGKS
ncbi:PUA-like domain-containing protein [Xylaria sp. CBS 124048]|nr:PUA-like domain-containing protein [Xylaria sp. CBS 124048]